MHTIKLKPGREKSLKRRHPWVFSGAVSAVNGNPGIGETVEVCDSHGSFLAYGAYSPHSQIRVRIWSWEPETVIDTNFFCTLLTTALSYRSSLVYKSSESAANRQSDDSTNEPATSRPPQHSLTLPDAQRLVHAESDGLPGLVVDRYGDILVLQILSAGPEYWRDTLVDLLLELSGAQHVFERSDVEVRTLEGLSERIGPLRGNPPESIIMSENDLKYRLNLKGGHKTGFYLDQRDNRLRMRDFAAGADVLDCFSYTGGFSLNALTAGAESVTAVESSEAALELARENLELNGFPGDRVEWLLADVFAQLRKFRDQGRKFDLVVLDPPKFAPTAALANKAARGYKDINLLALKLLRPNGTLMTFSCSGGVKPDLFQKIVAGAALDAGVDPLVMAHLEQSPDHPVALNFPEGAYLKGLVLRV